MYDRDIKPEDIQAVSNSEEVIAFFTLLGYQTSGRIKQSPANLGITNESLIKEIKNIELLANQDSLLQVYLFELSSVTVANTQALAKAFRNFAGYFLLVLTSDYQRIDFVLIEKMPTDQKEQGIGIKLPPIRPRVLTIDKLKPTRVDLRVLRRFSYTESDPIAQYEKLQAAYIVADWSEEFFNNKALFSDYFLLERLRDETEWKENIKPPYSRFKELYLNAKSVWSGKSEKEFRKGFLEPVFKTLGFQFREQKAADDESREPDYIFYSENKSGKPLCLCLTYPWGRSLDGKDYTRDKDTPDENPGAVVVSLLDKRNSDWVIVTNGKHWRLYSSKAHSRATNYYEIDLEEVLARLDPEESFRYFYLFFRREAFLISDGANFLDRLIKGSEEYAKKLGERLKKRIFEDVFPHFAEGFISYLRNTKGVSDFSQDDLDKVFHGTLTFLYRLLFILYAESRNLLPVRELRGYHKISLVSLKKEIADKLGNIDLKISPDPSLTTNSRCFKKEGNTPLNPLLIEGKSSFDEHSTALYDRLQILFKAIDLGDATINAPAYNGGLFMTNIDTDETHEAENARFLLENKLPDKFLAIGLDLLTRDEDDKTFKRVFIDYKSLGVRHLGSIYEGLLEFHVRIAPEKMAICEGKKTEEIIPYKEAVKEKKKILKAGRGKSAEERILPDGAVYLENTKHERKATGSYYTPDYIVKYIVENTVGPVLRDKFDALTPKFREAQRAYREAVKRKEAFEKRGQKGDNPDKTAFTYGGLVDDLFDVKVLDPAMGSGHFLVEAVDFITDKMIDFLNGFPWNPVMATLRETRETILKAMETQGITIDESRLNDLNLLKRHVLKRCIYGVDLNPMAVELAKVSLWLDCFTLGAPLSFLDHHLKCGNSLIGATVQEVREAVEPETKISSKSKVAVSGTEWKESEATFHQSTMFGSRFAGLMLATDLMRHVGELSDVTAVQVKESRSEYRKASDSLAPFRRILDVYVSQWFGNTGDSKGKKKKADANLALDFLKSGEAEKFISTKDLNKSLGSLSASDRRIAQTTINAAKGKQFFHWELEYPEVFYGKGTEKENPGFDAVVGNPPYDVLEKDRGIENWPHESLLNYIKHVETYSSCLGGKLNLYRPFIIRGLHLTKTDSYFGQIVPMSLLGDFSLSNTRQHVLLKNTLISVAAFPQKDDPHKRVFFDAKLSVCIPIVKHSKSTRAERFSVHTYPANNFEDTAKKCDLTIDDLTAIDPDFMPIPTRSQMELSLAIKLHSISICMKNVADITRGEINQTIYRKYITTDATRKPLLKGVEIRMFGFNKRLSQGEKEYFDENLFESEQSPKKPPKKRIAIQRITGVDDTRRLICAQSSNSAYFADSTNSLRPHEEENSLFLVGLLNSNLENWRFSLTSTNNNVGTNEIEMLPYPKELSAKQVEGIADLVKQLQKAESPISQIQQSLFNKLNQQIYTLYGLTEEEIKIVEGRG